jgi:hypothetical protein
VLLHINDPRQPKVCKLNITAVHPSAHCHCTLGSRRLKGLRRDSGVVRDSWEGGPASCFWVMKKTMSDNGYLAHEATCIRPCGAQEDIGRLQITVHQP